MIQSWRSTDLFISPYVILEKPFDILSPTIGNNDLYDLGMKETGKADKKLFLRFNNLAANICDGVILVSLREGSFDLAVKVVKFCVAEKNVMPGTLKDDGLVKYISACVDLGYTENAIEALEYCVDISSPRALSLGTKISTELKLTEEQQDYLNKLFKTYSKWVNI